MSRTAPLATALLSLLALGASPAHAFGTFSLKQFTVSGATGLSSLEWQCNDGIDNDGDGDIDSLDSDCDDSSGVPTIDLGGSANPGGDDIMPIPDFFLALDDTGADLGLYALMSESTDAVGDTTYVYDVVLSGLGDLSEAGLLADMSAGIADTDGDEVGDVVLAMPSYGDGLVISYSDMAGGEPSFYDYSGFLYTAYSSYFCSGRRGGACTSNVAEGLRIDSDSNTLLVDLGYSAYYGEGSGFYWTVNAASMASHVAEDGGLVYAEPEDDFYYYY